MDLPNQRMSLLTKSALVVLAEKQKIYVWMVIPTEKNTMGCLIIQIY